MDKDDALETPPLHKEGEAGPVAFRWRMSPDDHWSQPHDIAMLPSILPTDQRIIQYLYAAPVPVPVTSEADGGFWRTSRKFHLGDRVTKTKGSSWTGKIVGFYSTALTPVGYAVESENEPGSVQIYPEAALSLKPGEQG